jgi:hypothetical protein
VNGRPDERYLVVTEYGRVVVLVRGDRAGLDNDLIEVRRPDPDELEGVTIETPLRAFAAKMVDLVQARGSGDVEVSPNLFEMLVKEKAAEDLGRIERAARQLVHDGERES